MQNRIKLIGSAITFAFIHMTVAPVAAQVSDAEESSFSRPYVSSREQAIKDIIEGSSCAGETWGNRGEAPLGYLHGMGLSFARSLCRLEMSQDQSGAIRIMSEADRNDPSGDVFSWYRKIFSALKLPTHESGAASLRSLYTLGLGLGMRESSGKYCEGWDRSAGHHRSSSQAEAGLFQVSYDSIGVAGELERLYSEFRSQPQNCDLRTFQKEVVCKNSDTLGSGAGASFQKFVKSCPAFAVEYAMTLVRLVRTHFGPINRREAQIKPTCHYMFQQIQDYVNYDLANVCRDLL